MSVSHTEGTFDMLAKTMAGLEDVLCKELEALGASDIQPGRRMVAFKGDKRLLYKANVHLRTALRVLVPIDQFEARDAEELYGHLHSDVCWGDFLEPNSSFAFDTVVYSEVFTHSKFVAYRAKDAVSDFFREHADRRPNVAVADPDVRFHIHIADTVVTLALDSSGDSLHKRGYRVAQNAAPISEVLAAGILMRAGWDDSCPLLDPMCGSGTFLTEAALMAAHVPPGIFRDHFAFERWLDFDQELLDEILEEWDEVEPKHKIYGSDINPKAIAIARANIQRAGVQKYIDLNVCPIDDYTIDNRPADKGVIVMNPPYGERMRPESIDALYGSIGSTLKHAFSGWSAWIISAGTEGFDAVGLKHSVRQELYNGSIPCELRGYELFAGKRDEHLQELAEAGELPSEEERGAFYREQQDFRDSMTNYRKDGRSFESDRDRSRHYGGKPYGKRPHRDDDFDGEERPRRFDRGDREDRGGRRYDRGDRPRRFDRGDHEDRGGRYDREDRPRRFDRGDREDRGGRYDRGDREDHGRRFDRGDREDRGGRGRRYERGDRDDRQPAFRARLDDGERSYRPRRRYDDREGEERPQGRQRRFRSHVREEQAED